MKPISENAMHDMLGKLWQLKAVLLEEGDIRAGNEIQEICDKLGRKEIVIAFCGHFSAGKSSLINTLSGKPVLPSSPLPTSANVVFIRNGSPRAVLTSADSSKEPVEVPVEQVAEYCRNGQDYARVELWDKVELLGEGGVLLDTPGVDSNDASHALAAHSALHLADIVFYVMDYNHVSSETNLSFAKGLSDYGKPLYMVVNQIDKHRDEELRFDQYRSAVSQSFEAWNVKPQGIFYISLKQEDHPSGMLPELVGTIGELINNRTGLLRYSTYASAAQSVKSHLSRISEEEMEEREQLIEAAHGETDAALLEAELREIEHVNAESDQALKDERQAWLDKIGKMLDSAQLMTPALRELAGSYLESQAPSFKVKGWFGGGKTEAEKAKRCRAFLDALTEQAAVQVDGHVRQELRQIGQYLQVWSEEWETKLDDTLPRAEEAWIAEPLPGGAVLSGESTLRYAAAVAAGVTARFRRAAASVLDALLAAPSPLRAARQAALAKRRAELEARLPAARRLAELDAAARAREARYGALLGAPVPLTPGLLPEVREAAPRQAGAASGGSSAAGDEPALPAPAAPAGPRHADAAGGTAARRHVRRRALEAAARLEAAAGLLAPHPAFGTGVRELRKRAAELRRGRFTVALFGAFSGGKSSFASALLGSPVLPVSPHPTTASIGRIMAPENGHLHGTANVMFKSAEAMREDLAYSFNALQLGSWQESSWLDVVRRLKADQIPAAARAHFSFLKAAAAGWEQMAPELGTSRVVDHQEFREYAAEETKACYVAGIDFYYSCPLTEQGIVLVDTPGADSIHARHTGVTFQYMKNSDVIIFVTYYNHAFSRADKQLLVQLGRIKGSFALDKMFFVVNAADLASSPEELGEVTRHVRDGLRAAGIAEPNIYALSSLQALKGIAMESANSGSNGSDLGNEGVLSAPGARESGFAVFERNFSSFLENDLSRLAAASAAAELKQSLDRLSKWVESALQRAEHAEQQLEQLKAGRASFALALQELKAADISREWTQECGELLFHVVQRLRLSALDLFSEFFHPSLLQESSGPLKRSFAIAMRGWHGQISGELERELHATSLRLERKAESLLQREADNWCRSYRDRFDMPLDAPSVSGEWASPAIPDGLLGTIGLEAEDYWPYFKSPKSFFEGNGKAVLRDKLENPLMERIKEAVKETERLLSVHYFGEIALRQAELTEHFAAQWEEWEDSIRKTGASDQDLGYWEMTIAQLSRYGEEMEAFYNR
ncbi:dynamin family protein [Paenibacillus caui]|uniref:dynamin family protein n=1 Tax=Paenibacillus caui TaxID=2873927 RepID=UPI001CA869C5|nr:dynamin family protein [Paenibacillus caui]